jgi:hypothetical protein
MRSIVFCVLILWGYAVFAGAQVGDPISRREVDEAVKKIPSEAARAEDFVPAGWEVLSRAEGDLNTDGLKDYALDIAPPKKTASTDETEINLYDVVVVLFAESGGRWRRIGLNDRLTSSPFEAGVALSIEKGVLIVNSNYGNNYATDVTFRFRYDKPAAKLILIGFDFETYTRSGNEDGYVTSYNYLTGIREDTTNFIDRRKNATGVYGKSKTKRTRIKRVKVPFEKAMYSPATGDSEPSPF